MTGQVNHTTVINANLLNEARFAYLHGDPVTLWEAQNLSTTYTRGGSVPFTIGQSRAADIFGHQAQFSDTLSWSRGKHYLRFGGSVTRHTSGGTGSEPGAAILGTFTFRNTTTAPFDQLTLADVQNYTQPINFGISSYELPQWLYTGFAQDSIHLRRDLTIDVGLRYDRQTLTDAKKNFAPRFGFGWHPGGDSRLSIRGGYGMYYTQIRSNAVAGFLVNGLDGLTTYTATPGQLGFPTCLTGSCLPLIFDPKTLSASQLPARDITIRAGRRAFYQSQFAKYGLNFDLLPNYTDELVNPRSHVASIGAENEVIRGLFIGADYAHQRLTGIDRTVDLNAPSLFDRTAPGQFRCLPGHVTCPTTETVTAANITAGTLTQFASARPFNATTGVDNNGDGANNDRPVINGTVISKSAFRGTATSEVALFIESRIKASERMSILLRLEGFNIFNHGNYLGRGLTTYGDTGTPLPTFGQLAPVGAATNAIPAFANVDPPRMFQVQARFIF